MSIKGVDEFANDVIRTRKKEPASLLNICVNFIPAGRDTSSVALSWFFWLLHYNPEVEHKILQYVCTIVRARLSSDHDDDDDERIVFKLEEIKKMEYLHAAISEALRLYPSVVEDDIFPDGTILKKGTRVIYSIYSMRRMEAIWGKDWRVSLPTNLRLSMVVLAFVAVSTIYRYHVKLEHRLKVTLHSRDGADQKLLCKWWYCHRREFGNEWWYCLIPEDD
ncbi:hypothetical protein DVH24_006560 [Malus domestica]|uniref:Cytochrome P450 n=1 Tax=Malus domestica TaxID=3750 RepID=A0A498KIS1_MALDO|nr:hypothetical protein DVH24_006560 [Malus domestica]